MPLDKGTSPAGQEPDEFQVGRVKIMIPTLSGREIDRAVKLAADMDGGTDEGSQPERLEAGMFLIAGSGGIGKGQELLLVDDVVAEGVPQGKALTVSEFIIGRYLDFDRVKVVFAVHAAEDGKFKMQMLTRQLQTLANRFFGRVVLGGGDIVQCSQRSQLALQALLLQVFSVRSSKTPT